MLRPIKRFFSNYRTVFYVGIAGTIMSVAAYYSGYTKGYTMHRVHVAEQETKTIERGVQTREKIRKDILSLSDADLRKRSARWLRD